MTDDEKAQKWEEGCATDSQRNDFLIPELLRLIELWNPASILDIGTATAYVPRNLSLRGCGARKWHLVDMDKARLRLARLLFPESATTSYYEGDFFRADSATFEAELVLLCNTVLEFRLDETKIKHICECVRDEGHLIVSMPDTSTDAVSAYEDGNANALSDYISGSLTLQKKDHFTDTEATFIAHRTTDLICSFVNHGLVLVCSKRSRIGTGHYVFGFKKMQR